MKAILAAISLSFMIFACGAETEKSSVRSLANRDSQIINISDKGGNFTAIFGTTASESIFNNFTPKGAEKNSKFYKSDAGALRINCSQVPKDTPTDVKFTCTISVDILIEKLSETSDISVFSQVGTTDAAFTFNEKVSNELYDVAFKNVPAVGPHGSKSIFKLVADQDKNRKAELSCSREPGKRANCGLKFNW